jgi:hypothetical protein
MTICENCYREYHYGDDSFLKAYKHCILQESIDKEASQIMCKCSTVSHIGKDGSTRNLFPVDADDLHRGSASASNGALKCGLLNLDNLVAEAKYAGMLSKHEKKIGLGEQQRINNIREAKRKAENEKHRKTALKKVTKKSLIDPGNRVAEQGNSTGFEEDEANQEVPFWLRQYTNKYPFGNVHMALRVGPLIIENGVDQ